LLGELGLRLPFISENGGSISVPAGWFCRELPPRVGVGDWAVLQLGAPYSRILEGIAEIRSRVPATIRGFSDMTESEVADACGIPLSQAELARKRGYDEPITINPPDPEILSRIDEILSSRDLKLTRGGRFFHVSGLADKGVAVRTLGECIRARRGGLETVGIGDSANDVPMLKAVDVPMVVERPRGYFDKEVTDALANLVRVREVGPKGWAAAVMGLLQDSAG